MNNKPLTQTQEVALSILCSLLQNSARYEYVTRLVARGKTTQEAATTKNISKAYEITKQFLEYGQH